MAYTVHVHKRNEAAENTFIRAVTKTKFETYEEAERFATSTDGVLVKIFDAKNQILLSLVNDSNLSFQGDYV